MSYPPAEYDPERQPSKLLAGVKGSNQKSWTSGGTADILPKERARASFDHDTMTTILDGSKKITRKRRWIYGTYDDLEGPMADSRKYDMERGGFGGSVGNGLENFMKVHKKHFKRQYAPQGFEMQLMQNASIMGGYPGYGLFSSTVTGQASDEQLGWWMKPALTCEITGTYAQTELGHGSNVRGLETTATFDKETQTFIMETPTLTSMKFWPSSMVSATHAVVYAQLIIFGKNYGLHVFMVQLRDENFAPLPGIEVGDIGTKLGELPIDIGYLRLSKVRIPRKCMMEKRQYVTPEGEYVKRGAAKGTKGKSKMAYMTMMGARVTMSGGAAGSLSKACTIAIRYAAVRKQGFKDASEKEENAILDYKFTQYRLLKQLSFAIANVFANMYSVDKMAQFYALIAKNPTGELDGISEMHATSAGMKGLCCERTALGIEDARKACGGAGYLMASGIAALEVDYKWKATAEGDTVVMLLQTAKFLLKQAAAARKGAKLTGLAACLSKLGKGKFDPASVTPQKPSTPEGWLDLDFLEKMFEARTISAAASAEAAVNARVAAGLDSNAPVAESTLQMMRAGESLVIYFMLTCFKEKLSQVKDDACKKVLANVCALYGLTEVLDGPMWAGLMDGNDEMNAQAAAAACCSALRPEAVALVDSFEYPDVILNSTIGRKDGNVYEATYEATVQAPLNKKNVPPWFEQIKQYLDVDYLKKRNGEDGAANWSAPKAKL